MKSLQMKVYVLMAVMTGFCFHFTSASSFLGQESLPATIQAATYLDETEMRSLPNPDAKLIRKIPANELVKVLETELGAYCKVSYKGKIGYIKQNELVFEKKKSGKTPKAREESESAFSEPSINDVAPAPPNMNRTYLLGPRGGCYYINSHGNKQYVDRYLCE